jgi:hypothetical protein
LTPPGSNHGATLSHEEAIRKCRMRPPCGRTGRQLRCCLTPPHARNPTGAILEQCSRIRPLTRRWPPRSGCGARPGLGSVLERSSRTVPHASVFSLVEISASRKKRTGL